MNLCLFSTNHSICVVNIVQDDFPHPTDLFKLRSLDRKHYCLKTIIGHTTSRFGVIWKRGPMPSNVLQSSFHQSSNSFKMFDEIMCEITAPNNHYNDVIMNVMASQITSLMIVYSIVYSGADQRRHQSFASLAFLRGIHRWPVNSPHKRPVTRKMFPFDDVIMIAECQTIPIAFQVLVTLGLWGAAGTDEMDRPSQ